MSRGDRGTRVAKNIYRDQYGYAAKANLRKRSKEKRFGPDATIEEIQAWQQQALGQLMLDHPKDATPTTRTRDPFSRAVARYLQQLAGRPSARADAAHLAAWVERFGDRSRASITADDVRLAFAAWRTQGQRRRHQKSARTVKPQTLRHRYRVLKKLYRTLDGPTAPTPCDTVPRPKVPRTIPVDVPADIIKRVAAKLLAHNELAYARFLVLATTGKAPAELMRAKPEDIDYRRRLWRVHPAKGREPQLLNLNDEMIAALKVFAELNAFGPFDTTRYARVLRRCGWPQHIRPYNVRHALSIELLRRGADLGDVQAHLGHASIETTRRFYAGILKERAKKTSLRLNDRLGIAAKRGTKKRGTA